jgi:hypothetical protein
MTGEERTFGAVARIGRLPIPAGQNAAGVSFAVLGPLRYGIIAPSCFTGVVGCFAA